MEIEILEGKDNPFLKRKEIKAKVIHPNLPTPKKDEVIVELAKKYSVDPSQVVIDYILTKKGTTSSIIKAKILEEKPKEKLEEEKKTQPPKEEKIKEGGKVEAQISKS